MNAFSQSSVRSAQPARLPRWIVFLVALAVVAVVSGCSSGDPAEVRTNESTSTTAEADSPSETTEDSESDRDDSETVDTSDDDSDEDDSDTGGDDSDDDSGDDDDKSDDNSDDGDDDDDDSDDDDLPGEAWDGFAAAGDTFGVVGVAHDDVLNVRQLPDSRSPILTTFEPTETGIEATGEGRLLPSSIWYQVDTDAGVGWVNSRFVAFIGGTDDATSEYEASGSPTSAETMVDLADAIADSYILDEDVGTTVTQTVAPTVGDLGEITYDIIGLGDDAVGGLRLHIFAAENESGESFDLKSIERTVLCSRGTDGEACF